MKRTIISLLLAAVVICSIFINVFATEDTCPHIIIREPGVTMTK